MFWPFHDLQGEKLWFLYNFSEELIGYGCFARLPFWQFHATNLHHAMHIQQTPNPKGPHRHSNKLQRPWPSLILCTYTNTRFKPLPIAKQMICTHKKHIRHQHKSKCESINIQKSTIALHMLYTHINTTNVDFNTTSKPKIYKDLNAPCPWPKASITCLIK